jgi:8-amino-7-oxononanoate synthase
MSLMESPPGAETVIDGKKYLYFAGTGYFGLQGHPEVVRAGIDAWKVYGTHSATSRAGFGNNPALTAVEHRLKEYFGETDAAYFGSGYLSSLILVQGLSDHFEAIFADEMAHFCIVDAAASVGKPVFRFGHRDPDDLARQLGKKLKPRQRTASSRFSAGSLRFRRMPRSSVPMTA